MESSASLHVVESDSDVSARTRAQGRKRKADKQTESRVKHTLRSARTASNDTEKDASSHTTPKPNGDNAKKVIESAQQESEEVSEKAASAQVQNAIFEAQEKARKETELKNAIWSRITKVVATPWKQSCPEVCRVIM